MFVWLTLPHGLKAEDLFAAAIEEKVAFVPGSGFFAGEKAYPFMRLNYSACAPEQIDAGMGRLAGVIKKALAEGWHLGAGPVPAEAAL
jgi:2-aminoadipate transaminase